MKLRNRKTGEIRDIKCILVDGMFSVDSLAELNEEWEDYEEKEYFYLNMDGDIRHTTNQAMVKYSKEIGNYFETREEAEKAVEKLKAWKRIKDLGFRFKGHELINGKLMIKYDFSNNEADVDTCTKALHDVMFLFGGVDEQ